MRGGNHSYPQMGKLRPREVAGLGLGTVAGLEAELGMEAGLCGLQLPGPDSQCPRSPVSREWRWDGGCGSPWKEPPSVS